MEVNTDAQKIDEALSRGVEEVIGKDELRLRMLAGEKLRIKLGIDPTSPNVHIGRAIPLLKLRDFQELGHKVVFIVGDFTGIIGDTSDKESERPMLDREVIEQNKKFYYDQVKKILDMSKVEFHYNSEWLEKLGYGEIGEQANLFSVADFIARDNIRKRLDAGKRVSLREVLYPLMQGYDSVAIKADIEIGGTDQRFNILAGRTMQPHFGQKPQAVILGPLINGTDGRKMSSSYGNTITLTSEPNDMYGKVMSMKDTEIISYFIICTRIDLETVEEYRVALDAGANPRDIKMILAREIVRMYNGEKLSIEAEKAFVETFQKGNIPDDIPEILGPDYAGALVKSEIVASKNELHRLLIAGGVRNAETDEKYESLDVIIVPATLRIGKRRFVKLV